MEDNTILVFLAVMMATIVYGAYSGLVLQYPNILVLLLGAVVVYLFILELEFRQMAKIAAKMEGEENILTKSVRELREEVSELREAVRN
ncbi:MAG: hypothetical protein ACP5E4_02160 [Candidatus Aenigmatarchaeota archaeon]